MQFTLVPSKNLPSDLQIAALETRLSCTLPTSYRAFLKRYNAPDLLPLAGSNVTDDASICIFAKPSDAYEPEWWNVRFIELGITPEQYGLLQVYEVMVGDWLHLPDLLAFADTSGGVKFFLCVKGEGAGGVFMAGDRYSACVMDGGTPALKDYTLICESFDAFLDALRWVDYDKNGNEIVEPAI